MAPVWVVEVVAWKRRAPVGQHRFQPPLNIEYRGLVLKDHRQPDPVSGRPDDEGHVVEHEGSVDADVEVTTAFPSSQG
jgi:hypothetical protein